MVRLAVGNCALSFILILASTTTAMWPAFPSNMGRGTGFGNSPTSSTRSASSFSDADKEDSPLQKQRRGSQQAGNDADERCTCRSEILVAEAKSRENDEKLEALRTEVQSISSQLIDLKNSVAFTRDGRQAAPQSQGFNVAFSARVGYNRPYLAETEVIVFDELVINNGDVYDPYTGKFTSPLPGLYHFQTTILSGFNTTIETMIVRNGREVTRVFSGGFNNRGSGSNSVLLNMNTGDEVWVSVFFGNGDYVHGLWSTFTGFLVHPLSGGLL